MAVIDVYGDSNARMSDVLKLLSVHSLRWLFWYFILI
jgi:hypothetical protein